MLLFCLPREDTDCLFLIDSGCSSTDNRTDVGGLCGTLRADCRLPLDILDLDVVEVSGALVEDLRLSVWTFCPSSLPFLSEGGVDLVKMTFFFNLGESPALVDAELTLMLPFLDIGRSRDDLGRSRDDLGRSRGVCLKFILS